MNLFQKYGGADFWSDFLNVFYTRITASEILSHFFLEKDIDHIKSMLIGLLEVTLVTEGHYPEDALKDSHRAMNISGAELTEWIKIYTRSLRESGVHEDDISHMLRIVDGYRTSIVSRP
jgi:truncated hemoglobin YjbI